ncbi:MAG: hypothetical protein P4L10_00400 [Acidobacteriaceae bacterium]|nr:hypothetical protein [Acidobacteriaceae bacterium]
MSPFLAQSNNSRSLGALTLTLLGGVSSIVLGAQAANAGTLTGTTVVVGTPVSTTGTISATASVTDVWTPTGTVTAGNSLTFTLSGGAQFAAAPSVTALPNGSFGVGSLNSSNTAYSIQVSGSLVPGSATLSLTSVQISNYASSISGTSGAISLAYYATAGSDPAATLQLVTFAPAVSVTNSSAVAAVVDVPSGATRFVAGSTTTPLVALGGLTVTNGSAVTLTGATYAPNTSGSTLTLTGPLGGISTVFAVPSTTTVSGSTVPSSATTATPSGNSVSLAFPSTATTIPTGTYNVYGLATGSTILDTGSFNLGSTVSFGSGVTFTGPTSTVASTSYNGTVATVNYAVGGSSGYASYLYVTNRSLSSVPVLVSVRPSTGTGPFSGTLVSALAANSSALISGSQIDSALGTSLFTSAGQRSSLRVLVGTTSAAVTGLLLNPSGDVSDIGLSFSGSN